MTHYRSSRPAPVVCVVIVGMMVLATTACNRAPAEPEPGPLPPPTSPPAPFDPWQNARERGIDFRAIGQEPGWVVEVDHERGLRLVLATGGQQVVSPAPLQPVLEEGTTLYRVTTPSAAIEVAIEDAVCTDSMSGERLARTVTVNMGGRALRGCGQPLR